jgi:SAM-dependent methyltransferase
MSSIAIDVEPEVTVLKSRLRQTWMAGDYDRFSRFMEGGAREFFDRLDVAPGSRLLDVACGSGQLALIAARDGLEVTGVDIAPNLVRRARDRARAEGLNARFEEVDAEDLPFEDASFDFVTSLIGAMFAPRPELVARQLLRVCAPGGTIAMANWTPEGFVGQMFRTISKFIAPSGMPSPVLWGDEGTVRKRLGPGATGFKTERRPYIFEYPFPPSEVVDFFRRYYGPMSRAFESLDLAGQEQLRNELEALWAAHNTAGPDLTRVAADWLEVHAIRA